MEVLATFCSECSPLNNVQLENLDNQRRLRSIAAMFLGMKDNVSRVLQAKANGSCAVTPRMDNWCTSTVEDARALVKKLLKQPTELGFFAKGCLGFCSSSTPNEEAEDRKMGERVNTLLSKTFVIQAAIFYEEISVVVDIDKDITIDSARQEFLGCVYDFNKRIVVLPGSSEQAYKELLTQISGEYQKRQDVRTEAGKRAFIRWHKAANDMIKTQLQQKLSEREEDLELKEQKIGDMSAEILAVQQQRADLEKRLAQLRTRNTDTVTKEDDHVIVQLESLKRENQQLAAELAGKAEVELLLGTHEKREKDLHDEMEKYKSEKERVTVSYTNAQEQNIELEQQLKESKAKEESLLRNITLISTELESSKKLNTGTTEKSTNLEKELAARVAEIVVLNEKLAAAENHNANGASDVNTLKEQLKAKENELNDAQKELTEMDDEMRNLQAMIKSNESEMGQMTETIQKMTAEMNAARNAASETEQKYKNWDAEMKALRDQLKEKQDEVVRLLEQNVELEETCRTFQQKISTKEEEVMKMNERVAELEEETKKNMAEKTETIETLERKVKRLTTSLENTRKDLKSTKAELEEVQNKL